MSVSAAQIREHVESVRRNEKYREARRFGIRSLSPWSNGDSVQIEGAPARIVQIDSPLHAREMLRHASADEILVLVTGLSERELGLDVMARLARQKLGELHPWAAVRTLFKATDIDPRVVRESWIPDVILRSAPVAGYKPVSGVMLDLETIWSALLGTLGLSGPRPDLRALLDASSDAEFLRRYMAMSEPFRAGLRAWIEATGGSVVLAALETLDRGRGAELPAIGLALSVLFADDLATDPGASKPRVRAEVALGNHLDEARARQWGRTAIEWLDHARANGQTAVADAACAHAEVLLEGWQGGGLAWVSDHLPRGFEQRLDRLASALGVALEGEAAASIEPVIAALETLASHRMAVPGGAAESPRRRAEMAVRLLCWLRRALSAAPTTLADAAKQYVQNGSFADWARESIRDGEGHADLTRHYLRLVDEAATRREDENRDFADMLVRWTRTGELGGAVLPIEDVLAQVVAPLAREEKVLLLVLDGMSLPIMHQLADDLERSGWQRTDRAEASLPPVISALPSITQVSRASLLCGKLAKGGQDVERDGFTECPALQDLGGRGGPKLFHKAELSRRQGDELSGELKKAINGEGRVVAAVINVIDDQLSGGAQLRPDWDLSSIPVLERLLFWARTNRRVVILASDHGHVVETGAADGPATGNGHDRYRLDVGSVAEGELHFTGRRVLVPEGGDSVILPWSERLRYSRKSAGYHGGATPQEVIAPLAILVPETIELKGWTPVAGTRPMWWGGPEAVEPIKLPKVVSVELPAGDVAEPSLFQPTPQPTGHPDWIRSILDSDVYADQKTLAGRAALPDDDLVRMLLALDLRNGTLTTRALAAALEQPAFRLGGILMSAARVLNVDGFSVLEHDTASQTVRLDRRLLAIQFQLEDSG